MNTIFKEEFILKETYSKLRKEIKKNEIKVVESILSTLFFKFTKDDDFLDLAINLNRTEIVELLLKSELIDNIYSYHFEVAANNQNLDIIKLLLNFKQDRKVNTCKAIFQSIYLNNIEITNYLIKEARFKQNDLFYSLLSLPLKKETIPIVEELSKNIELHQNDNNFIIKANKNNNNLMVDFLFNNEKVKSTLKYSDSQLFKELLSKKVKKELLSF